MSIKGNTVGMTMPRTNYEQTDKTKPEYLKGKDVLDKSIQDLKDRLDKLVSNEDDEGNSTVTNVATPENPTDAANKDYVDAVVQTQVVEKIIYVETTESGEEVEHISGGGTTIVNVAAPANPTDAANKDYVDTKIVSITLLASGWSNSAPYTQTVEVDGLTDTLKAKAYPVWPETMEDKLALSEETAKVRTATRSGNAMTFECWEDKPALDIPVMVEVYV